ncbi:MAG: TRM11 family SAM-dependent methyltransferase [Steroidobacteraceae bacterium]
MTTGARPQIPLDGTTVDSVEVETRSAGLLTNSLAYWQSVDNGRLNYTVQVLREATVSIARNGVPLQEFASRLPFRDEIPVPGRRCLRYATHGLHEYRGKFFPQLVRALINIGLVPKNGIVADPMCGSGTTVAESLLAGRRSLGLDLNPLSVRLAKAKASLLSVEPDSLLRAFDKLRTRLARVKPGTAPLRHFRQMPVADQDYLRRWFSENVLRDLDAVAAAVLDVSNRSLQDFFFIALSNILRRVSWQKTDDLRVRRDFGDAEPDAVAAFLAEVERSTRMLSAFLYQDGPIRSNRFNVDLGDARHLSPAWSRWRGRIDAVITSPPYATALPYLDTDRLSLCYLGLLTRPEHRQRDQQMIGNREITDAQRRRYWDQFEASESALPESVSALVRRINSLNARADVGFRRKNVAALLTKYFFDMKAVLSQVADAVKPGAPVFVVVGSNHTIAGGERIDIRTASLLGDLAESLAYERESDLPMEMLRSRDIFKQNASESETLLMLRAPGHS